MITRGAIRRRVASLMVDYGLRGFSVRVGRLQGVWAHCDYAAREIVMNSSLLRTDWVFIDQIARHEVAHGIAGAGAGHSKSWMEVARAMGYRLGAVVPYDAPISGVHRWVERCETGMHSAIKFERGRDGLFCRPCHESGGGLVSVGWETL